MNTIYGKLPKNFNAAVRALKRKYPDWSSEKIKRYIVGSRKLEKPERKETVYRGFNITKNPYSIDKKQWFHVWGMGNYPTIGAARKAIRETGQRGTAKRGTKK